MDVVKIESTDKNPIYEVSHPTRRYTTFYVKKANDGFSLFEITASKGAVPRPLSGKYTKPEKALEALRKFLSTAKETKTTRRDNTYERNHAPAIQPDSEEYVQQGTAD